MQWTTDAPVTVDVAAQHAAEARRNANTVISASLFVEREIEALISNYLFPSDLASEQKTFVTAHILGSDALSFAAKRRVLLALARQKGWLAGKDADSFDKLLVKIGSLRNAVTHGNVIEGDKTTILSYFESKPREEELTDTLWDAVVATFTDAIARIEQLKIAAKVSSSSAVEHSLKLLSNK